MGFVKIVCIHILFLFLGIAYAQEEKINQHIHLKSEYTNKNEEQTGSYVSAGLYTVAALIPVVFAGLMGIDGNFANEWKQFLTWSVIGGGLLYKGYQNAPNKDVYVKSVGSLCTAAILVPGISQKITDYKINN